VNVAFEPSRMIALAHASVLAPAGAWNSFCDCQF
jgi:hypothetical protein